MSHLLVAGLLAAPAAGQDFRQSIPRIPEAQPPVVPPSPAEDMESGSPQPILPALKGMRFVADMADEPAARAIAPDGVVIAALPLLDTAAFRARAEADIGKPASIASLNRLARAAVEAYRAAGRPLVDVAVPEQSVTDGTVTFLVREFVVGDVVIEGNRHFSTDQLRRGIRLEPGQALDQNRLIEDLNGLSRNPFRRIDLVYRRADAPLTTDVVVKVTDRFPWRFYAVFENNGTPATGRERWSVGVNWGNAFGADGQLAYQYTASQDRFENRRGAPLRFQAHSFTWLQPLSGNRGLILFGTYQETAPDLGAFFGQTGKSYQLSPRFTMPFLTSAKQRGVLTLGYDFKQTDNDLLFGGTTISADSTQIHQLTADFTLSRQWALGLFSAANSLYFSPGGIGRRNSDEAFQPGPGKTGTPFARATYLYWRGVVTQQVPLGRLGAEAVTRVTAQLATSNLLPSEQLSVAGPGFVRSYDPNAVLGSRGLIVSQELWGPDFGPGRAARLGFFADAGMAGNNRRLEAEPRWVRTASVGVMGRAALGRFLELRGDFGTQLRTQPGRTRRGEVGYISVVAGF